MSIYVRMLIASFLWGSNVIVMKLLLNKIDFLFLAFIRVFLSFFFLLIYIIIKRIPLTYKEYKKSIIISVFVIYLNFLFTFLGMKSIKGVDNAFVNALSPLFSLVLSFFLLKYKWKQRDYILCFVSLFSFLLSIHFHITSISSGLIYLFIGLIFYLIGNNLVKKWNLNSSLLLSFYELMFGSLFLGIYCFLRGKLHFDVLLNLSLGEWVLFLIVSCFGFAYIQVNYMESVRLLGTTTTSFFMGLNPLITYIESLFMLKESFDLIHFLSFIILGIGLIYYNFNKKLLDK